MKNKSKKLLVILGPTASGKSALAVELAQIFQGEIISADSRQVYKGLDIGANKITKEEMKGIPHHLLDVADPKIPFSVEQYKTLAREAIAGAGARDRLPILCGGSGFYISAVLGDVSLPQVPPNPSLRASLAKETPEALFARLQKLDPARAQTIDPSNKIRVIRAIEIARALGKVPPLPDALNSAYDTLQIGLIVPDEALKAGITVRIFARIREGMIEEAQRLHEGGLSYGRMHELGLEYRALAEYLQGGITGEKLAENIDKETWQYVKRQKTWFKRDARIRWFKTEEKEKIIEEVGKWLKK